MRFVGAMLAVAVALLTTAARFALLPAGRAAACSCAQPLPTIADLVGQSEVSFVGRLVSAEILAPPERNDVGSYDRRYELVVEHGVKGVETGDRVIMFGDSAETSCGTSLLDETMPLHAVISTRYNGRFVADSTPPCWAAPTPDELLAADLALPPTSQGPVSLVVVGRLGEAELIGYDAGGQPVAYGDLLWRAGRPAVCPTSARIVQLEQAGPTDTPVLTIRNTASLGVVARTVVDVPPEWRPTVSSFLVDGAELSCRSADGGDVVAVLPWESSAAQTTLVISFHAPDDGGISVSAYDHASRARYDHAHDTVIAVWNGVLVQLGVERPEQHVVAQLTASTAEVGSNAMFIEPDGSGGWWVGLGDGDGELLTHLALLTHVGGDGGTEQWPVDSPPDVVTTSVALVDDSLVSDQYTIPLPAAGSAATGMVVIPTPSTEPPAGFRLGDGRVVRAVVGDDHSSVELVGSDGSSTTLRHLAEARSATAVIDGPLSDPGTIDRSFPAALVESPWIVHPSVSSLGTTADTRQTTVGAPSAPPAHGDQARSDSTRWWVAAVAAGALLCAATVVVLARRR